MNINTLIDAFRQEHPEMFNKPTKDQPPIPKSMVDKIREEQAATKRMQEKHHAAEKEMRRMEMQLRAEMEQQKYMMMQNATMGVSGMGGAGGVGNAIGVNTYGNSAQGLGAAASQYISRPEPPRFNPNKTPATKMPLSALVDLWRAKFQDEWIDLRSPANADDVEFWAAGEARLERMGKLEIYEGWARIREDA